MFSHRVNIPVGTQQVQAALAHSCMRDTAFVGPPSGAVKDLQRHTKYVLDCKRCNETGYRISQFDDEMDVSAAMLFEEESLSK